MAKYQIRLRKKNPGGKPGAVVGRLGSYPTQKAAKTDAQRLADKRVFNPATQITVEAIQGSPRSRSSALRKSQAIAKATRYSNPKKTRKFNGKVYTYAGTGPKSKANRIAKELRAAGSAARVVKDGKQWALYTRLRTAPVRSNPRLSRRRTSFTAPVAENDRFTGPVSMSAPTAYRKNPSDWTYLGHDIVGKRGDWTVLPYGKRFKKKTTAKRWISAHVRRESRSNPPRRANGRRPAGTTYTIEVYDANAGRVTIRTHAYPSLAAAKRVYKTHVKTRKSAGARWRVQLLATEPGLPHPYIVESSR